MPPMARSARFLNSRSSERGTPIWSATTDIGSSSANCFVKSTLPSSTNPSIRSVTISRTYPSIAATRRAESALFTSER